MNLTDQLHDTLTRDRDQLIRLATERAVARCGGAVPESRLRDELGVCLDVLAVAVDLGATHLFANHITWTLPALHGPDGDEVVEKELAALRQTLLAELPLDLLGLVAVYLVEAAHNLRQTTESRQRSVRQRQQRAQTGSMVALAAA